MGYSADPYTYCPSDSPISARRVAPDSLVRLLGTLEAAPTSDIDIAITGVTAVAPTVMREIHEEIERLPTLRKVQIIDVQHVHDRFRDRVLSQGQVLTYWNAQKP